MSTQTTTGSTNVNEEYKKTLRTKSYTDIVNQVEQQLGTSTNLDEEQPFSFPSTSCSWVHLIIEPHQETLLSISGNPKYLYFLHNYFNISQEAGRICESILLNLHQVRLNYDTIKNVAKLVEKSPDYTRWTHNQYKFLFNDLTSFSHCTNPFSTMTPTQFDELHDRHLQLFHQLTSKCRKIKKRAKFIKFITRVVEKRKQKESRVEEELDIAARGLYALINDFDTMGLLVKILKDEMEHNKSVAERCAAEINCGTIGKNEGVLKQVSTEFQMQDYHCFQEHLQELEQQIYMSFLHINRSRKRLLQELHK